MDSRHTNQFLIALIICIAVFSAAMLVFLWPKKTDKVKVPQPVPVATTTDEAPVETKVHGVAIRSLGLSVEGRQIDSYTFGDGKTQIVFVGGIHGGYEWNSVLLGYELIDYLGQNPELIPKNLEITVIPSMNPDGVFKVTGKEGRFAAADVPAGANEAGRLNAHGVDLNRNFDCNWKAKAVWKNKPVSAGTAAFSEPESAAFKKFVLENNLTAVVFYHSQSNAIYGSQCNGDMLAETAKIMDVYSKASGYKTVATFDGYAVTGDVTDWLSTIGKPAMTVELATHKTTEREKNLAGVKALFKYYENKK
jgi:hypothetical protein